MRKVILALIAAILIFSLCGCSEAPEGELSSAAGDVFAVPDETPPEYPEETEVPFVEETMPAPTPNEEDEKATRIFREFLSDNYDKLMELSFKSIAGIGFIDLDLDGVRELILFDAGASASMGVQFFDIVDGEVQCVSSNIQGIGEAFGGKYFSDIIVNANFMEDFRLRENKSTGERVFVVESKNGSIESFFSETIRFGSSEGVLTLSPVFYKYEEYNTETSDVLLQKFLVGGKDATASEYSSAADKFESESKDMGLECRGVFIWENDEYSENYKSFMENVDKALALYEQNREPAE